VRRTCCKASWPQESVSRVLVVRRCATGGCEVPITFRPRWCHIAGTSAGCRRGLQSKLPNQSCDSIAVCARVEGDQQITRVGPPKLRKTTATRSALRFRGIPDPSDHCSMVGTTCSQSIRRTTGDTSHSTDAVDELGLQDAIGKGHALNASSSE
jgi:hypothetical protein